MVTRQEGYCRLDDDTLASNNPILLPTPPLTHLPLGRRTCATTSLEVMCDLSFGHHPSRGRIDTWRCSRSSKMQWGTRNRMAASRSKPRSVLDPHGHAARRESQPRCCQHDMQGQRTALGRCEYSTHRSRSLQRDNASRRTKDVATSRSWSYPSQSAASRD